MKVQEKNFKNLNFNTETATVVRLLIGKEAALDSESSSVLAAARIEATQRRWREAAGQRCCDQGENRRSTSWALCNAEPSRLAQHCEHRETWQIASGIEHGENNRSVRKRSGSTHQSSGVVLLKGGKL